MHETVRTLWKVAAWVLAIIGVAAGILYLRIPWVPRIDFDILGVAWLLMNSAKLGAFAVMVISLLYSAYLCFRLWLDR